MGGQIKEKELHKYATSERSLRLPPNIHQIVLNVPPGIPLMLDKEELEYLDSNRHVLL